MVEMPKRTAPAAVRCRRIVGGDRDALAAHLHRNFPRRSLGLWHRAFDRLHAHSQARHDPHFGYVLEAGGRIVGAILMIFSGPLDGGASRCNLSSWCVDPDYRAYAALLVQTAIRNKDVTYVNISPDASTRPIIEAQGFARYCDSLFMGAPLLTMGKQARARLVDADGAVLPPGLVVDAADARLMRDHEGFDCLRVWCITGQRARPLIFARCRRLHGMLPTAHVVYSGDPDLVRGCGAAIGRFLARRGLFVLTMDATTPIPGMAGRLLTDRMPKYSKGPQTPRLGDLAFTEMAMFGT